MSCRCVSGCLAIAVSLSAAAAGASVSQEWGDAPDDQNVCQAATMLSSSDYPTQPGTTNALPGRTAPVHDPSGVPALANFYFAEPPSTEIPPFEAECDWLTGIGDTICDRDNVALVLCLNAACNTGVFFGGSDPNCDELGAAPFGVAPTTTGFYLYEATREPGSTQPAYINVAADFSLSGRWGDLPGEWLVADQPLAAPGWPSQVLVTPAFPITTLVVPCPTNPLGWCIDPFWTRFLVSTEAIAAALPPSTTWDGSGQSIGYVEGETEDVVPATDPATVPLLPPPTYLVGGPATISITLNPGNPSCTAPTVVPLSGHARSTEIRRFGPSPFISGETVPIEIVALELQGVDGVIGPVIVREPASRMSLGLLQNVVASGGSLTSASSFFDVFVEVDLPSLGSTLHNTLAAHLDAVPMISSYPPVVPTSFQGYMLRLPTGLLGIPLYDGANQLAGYLCGLGFAPMSPVQEILFSDGFEPGHTLAWSDREP